MFAGAIDRIGRPNTEVVFREIQGNWLGRSRDPSGIQTQQVPVDDSVGDPIPLDLLLETQSELPDRVQISFQKPKELPIEALMRAGIAINWNWESAFQACGFEAAKTGSFLFEEFAAASLLALGMKDFALNLTGSFADGTREVDVVALFRGRLLILDCKSGKDLEFKPNIQHIQLDSIPRHRTATTRGSRHPVCSGMAEAKAIEGE